MLQNVRGAEPSASRDARGAASPAPHSSAPAAPTHEEPQQGHSPDALNARALGIVNEITIASEDEEQPLSTAGFIDGIDCEGRLRVVVAFPLTRGIRVRIGAGDAYSAGGKVMNSYALKGRFFATIHVHDDGRRREARIPVNKDAEVIVLGAMPEHVPVRITDVSKSGMGMIAAQNIKRNALINMALNDVVILAEVRHCATVGTPSEGYRVGVEIRTVLYRSDGQTHATHGWRSLVGSVGGAVRKLVGRQVAHASLG